MAAGAGLCVAFASSVMILPPKFAADPNIPPHARLEPPCRLAMRLVRPRLPPMYHGPSDKRADPDRDFEIRIGLILLMSCGRQR